MILERDDIEKIKIIIDNVKVVTSILYDAYLEDNVDVWWPLWPNPVRTRTLCSRSFIPVDKDPTLQLLLLFPFFRLLLAISWSSGLWLSRAELTMLTELGFSKFPSTLMWGPMIIDNSIWSFSNVWEIRVNIVLMF